MQDTHIKTLKLIIIRYLFQNVKIKPNQLLIMPP